MAERGIGKYLAWLALSGLVQPGTGYAAIPVHLSGFGTLGVALEHHADLAPLRDNNQRKDPGKNINTADSILGVQLATALSDQWRATAQWTWRERPEQGLDESTEWLFLGYRPRPEWDVRVGRVAVDMFQLSDFRRVDYANLWVRPPTELYAWILPASLDGGDVAVDIRDGERYWRFKLQYGKTDPWLDAPDGTQTFHTEFNQFLVATATLDYENWKGRISYSQARTADSVPGFVPALSGLAAIPGIPGPVGQEAAELARRLSTSAERVRYWQGSLGYDNGEWILDTEVARQTTSGTFAPTGTAGYVSVGYRRGNWTPYLVHARFFPDAEPFESQADWNAVPGIAGLRDAALDIINGVLISQRTWSLGARWDPAPRYAFKMQWDHTRVASDQYALWAHRNGRSHEDAVVNILSFSLSFVF